MELVLQGPVHPYTAEIVRRYLEWEAVERIIVSCWETCPALDVRDHRVLVLYNRPVAFGGIGNLNRQIESSRRGLELVRSACAAKMRTDQLIALESLEMMDAFHWRFRAPEVMALDGDGPRSRIFVLGGYTRFPFHPRDHVFWGHTADLRRLFDLPFTQMPQSEAPDYRKVLRPEIHLGAHYAARFHPAVRAFVEAPLKYLVDEAPRLCEALAVSAELGEKVFKVFPRIDMQWPKHGLQRYHYDVGASLSEYWHETAWR